MLKQAQDAMHRYRQNLEHALQSVPRRVKAEAIQDAEEFLSAEILSMDVGRLTSEKAAFNWFVQRLGTPEQLAAGYACTEGHPNIYTPTLANRWSFLAVCFGLFLCVMGSQSFDVHGNSPQDFPKLSPFTNVVFENDTIIVGYDDKTWHLARLDGISAEEIVASAKEQFGSRWQKRISEDLVELLDGMDHRVGETVSLVLVNPDTRDTRAVRNAAMTEENRRAVWKTNNSEFAETMEGLSKAEFHKMAAERSKFAADSTGYLHKQLQQRWAYYSLRKRQVDAAFQDLKRKQAKLGTPEFSIELQKAVSAGIDGHAGVSDLKFLGRCLPFLIEPTGDKVVAFSSDRKSFVDDDHPLIKTIDGVPISEWCEESSQLVAKGSPQLVQKRSLRLLRHVDYWRTQLELPIPDQLKLELTSVDGKSTVSKTVDTIARKPVYGEWPRSDSKILDNDIGYLRLKSMDSNAVNSIRRFMPKFRDARGLIVDVRGNGGGSRDALRWMFSYLMSPSDSPRVVNAAKYRLHKDYPINHLEARFMYSQDSDHWSADEHKAIIKFAAGFKPQWQPPRKQFSDWHYMVLNRLDHDEIFYFDKPIVVLCDEGCFSATDIFLAGLKGWKNVTLVGTASSGGSARSVSVRIPGTLKVRIASMASFQPDGKLYDGNGVKPNQVVEPTAEYFIGGEDNALVKAIKIIGP